MLEVLMVGGVDVGIVHLFGPIMNLTPRPTPRSSERQALLAGEGANFLF